MTARAAALHLGKLLADQALVTASGRYVRSTDETSYIALQIPVEGVAVTVRVEVNAPELTRAHVEAAFAYLAVAANNWHAIDQVGYCLALPDELPAQESARHA